MNNRIKDLFNFKELEDPAPDPLTQDNIKIQDSYNIKDSNNVEYKLNLHISIFNKFNREGKK